MRGSGKLTGENLKVVWVKFLTLSWPIFLSKVESAAWVLVAAEFLLIYFTLPWHHSSSKYAN
jgi:hypothetical protein